MKNLGTKSFWRFLFVFSFVATAAFSVAARAAEDIRAGTWQLVKRQLPDGTTLTSPNVGGMFTVHPSGVYHVNIFWKTPDGKWASNSNITQFKYSESDLSQTRLFGALDMGNGNPVVYVAPGETKRVPVKREGGRISYQHPLDPPFIVIDGDTLTATLEGVFIDTWERMK
jgi:hypothetical protein